jgi:hypothetical protein
MMSGYENLGPAVSQNPQAVTPGGGSFAADERAYDSLVFQQNCPPMDWEVNLLQSVIGNAGLRSLVSKLFPSSFISGDILESDAPGSSYSFLSPIAGHQNKFGLSACDLFVNGWNIHLEYTNTGTDGLNIVELEAPPVSGIRQDLVILEVWRALISPLPSTDNKSPAGQIYRFGNSKAPDAAPNVNLSDDLIDPSYGSETARRVQVQYRLRSISGVDFSTYLDGLGDPSTTAHTVSYYLGSTVDGNNLPTYSFNPVSNDPGLWRAGNGDSTSATDIGSVDGYIYAIPVCGVVRRNSSAFDRSLNLNGGSLIGSPSTRPDQLFSDQVVSGDILDLRKYVCQDPIQFRNNAANALLRNALSTQVEVSSLGIGGSTFCTKDSIGSGGHIGDADGVRMSFSDRPITQPVAIQNTLAAPTASITLALNAPVDLPWLASLNILAKAPTGTALLSVNKAFYDDGAGNTYDLFDSASTYHITSITYSISGTVIDTASITFNIPVPAGQVIWEALIEYPRNCGLSRNTVELKSLWVPNSFAGWVDTLQFDTTSDANRNSSKSYYSVNPFNRELSFALPTVSTSVTVNSITTTTIMVPDMVDPGSVSLGGGHSVTNIDINAGCTLITFTPAVASPGLPISVTYVGLRAHPPLAAAPFDTIDVFTTTRAIQSIPVPAGASQNYLVKRTDLDRMFFITAGSGSYENALYDCASQFPIPSQPSSNYSDSLLIGYHESNTVANDDVTGISKIPVTSGGLENPADFWIKSVGGVTKDADGRNFWPLARYSDIKSLNATNQSAQTPRKLVADFVVELSADIAGVGRKGTLFLAAAVGFMRSDITNEINLNPSIAIDGVALYRLRGNPVYSRRIS